MFSRFQTRFTKATLTLMILILLVLVATYLTDSQNGLSVGLELADP